MGKIYIDTVKYLVYANLEIDGLVEKPDVVGAVFGQTEGLLGDELDLRELQKNGRIGRIEVELNPRGGKSVGKITLPSSLDMVETSILAAALETVDRVGPCDARINVEKIEDTRNVKRKQLVDRAKALLKNMLLHEIPESREISELVRQEVKIAEISEYGPEKLPSGPGIEKYESIIIVEGRADVLNLLKNDVANVVAVGGANVPQTIAKLCKEKEITVFLDGDRGGDIILRELSQVADIDFVARAPQGKEVEELPRKELIKALRSKISYQQALDDLKERGERRGGDRRFDRDRRPDNRYDRREPYAPRQPVAEQPVRAPGEPQQMLQQPQIDRESVVQVQPGAPINVPAPPAPAPAQKREVPAELLKSLDELENTLRARLYDKELKMFKEIPVRDMIKSLEEEKQLGAVVFDGIITQRLADLVGQKGAAMLVGVKLGNVFRKPDNVLIHAKA